RRARRSPRSADSAPATGPRIPLDRFPLTDGAITLRAFALSDAAAVAEACRSPDIPRWTFMSDGLTVPQAREGMERAHDMLVRARAVRLAIVDATDGTFHGQIGVGRLDWEQQRGEIFYWLAASARGRGIATASVRAITPWAFEVLNLARIEIIV